jgi:hypothetical protein
MIPAARPDGYLPAGIHQAPWTEFERRYDVTPHRHILLQGLQSALVELSGAGCPRLYVGGSFLTPKPDPNDIDCCFDYAHDLDWARLAAADLLNTANDSAAQRARYGCEFHFANMAITMFGPIAATITFLEFYQRDVDGEPVGVVALDLGSFP